MLNLTTKKDKQLFFAVVSAFMPEKKEGEIQNWHEFSTEISPLLSLNNSELKGFAKAFNIEHNMAFFPKYYKPANHPFNDRINKNFIYLHNVKNIFKYLDNIDDSIPSSYTLLKLNNENIPEMIVIDWNTLPKLLKEIKNNLDIKTQSSKNNNLNKVIENWKTANNNEEQEVIVYQNIKEIMDSNEPIKDKLEKVRAILNQPLQQNIDTTPDVDTFEEQNNNENLTLDSTTDKTKPILQKKKRGQGTRKKQVEVPENIILTKAGNCFKTIAAAKAAKTRAIKKGLIQEGEIISYGEGFAIKS